MQHIQVLSEQLTAWRPAALHDLDLTSGGEAELIERARLDPRAFAPLYDRHFSQIYRYVYSKVRDQGAAEDVTAEVFTKALAAMPRYQHNGRPFSAWLYRIAANTIIDRGRGLRLCQPLGEIAGPSAASPTEELVLRRDEILRIWALVDALPPEQRKAVVLRFRNDMRVNDIATAMGKSSGAVKLLIHRGVHRLRAEAPALRPAV